MHNLLKKKKLPSSSSSFSFTSTTLTHLFLTHLFFFCFWFCFFFCSRLHYQCDFNCCTVLDCQSSIVLCFESSARGVLYLSLTGGAKIWYSCINSPAWCHRHTNFIKRARCVVFSLSLYVEHLSYRASYRIRIY